MGNRLGAQDFDTVIEAQKNPKIMLTTSGTMPCCDTTIQPLKAVPSLKVLDARLRHFDKRGPAQRIALPMGRAGLQTAGPVTSWGRVMHRKRRPLAFCVRAFESCGSKVSFESSFCKSGGRIENGFGA